MSTPYLLKFGVDEVIFREGDAPTTAFLVESGRVRISTDQNGRRVDLGELGPGSLLGEMAVLDDSPRMATATAVTVCELMPIDRAQFSERLQAAEPVVYALMMSQLTRYRSALRNLVGAESGKSRGSAPIEQLTDSLAMGKIRLESDLRAALDRGELEVCLQPLLELASDRIAGYEALIRWQHPLHGVISPSEFIHLAEETSLILPVGDYVIDRVCSMLAELRERDDARLPFIALNVSARQVADPRLIERILERLHAHGVAPRQLVIEITESLVLDDPAVRTLLDQCHAVGIQVALDDFGTGFSNLVPLLSLDFDRIKLDQAFVRAIETTRGEAIVRAVVDLAAALGCSLTAEGVETPAQLALLRDLGCRYAQGWLIGRAVPLQAVLDGAGRA